MYTTCGWSSPAYSCLAAVGVAAMGEQALLSTLEPLASCHPCPLMVERTVTMAGGGQAGVADSMFDVIVLGQDFK